jgi:hypothetical protein
MKSTNLKLQVVVPLLALWQVSAWAFGPVGHEVVAYIAEDRLLPATRQKINAILAQDEDLASIANWADQVRATSRPETAPWHFIDIEVRQNVTEADEPRFCTNQDCVVAQIEADINVLKDDTQSKPKKVEALKFLVHFIGDVHQPLHCADDTDRGGNEKSVHFKTPGTRSRTGTKIKLHALWDHLIEVKTAEDPRDLATELEKDITSQNEKDWSKGEAKDWAWESFTIAHDDIYSEFDPGPTDPTGVQTPADYYTGKMRTIVDRQLEKAGVRLAHVLNSICGN